MYIIRAPFNSCRKYHHAYLKFAQLLNFSCVQPINLYFVLITLRMLMHFRSLPTWVLSLHAVIVISFFLATFQISLSYQIQNMISLALMQEEVPNCNLFNRAQKSIYSIMENDSMPRFLQSKMSKAVIKQSRRSTFCSSILKRSRHGDKTTINDSTPLYKRSFSTRISRNTNNKSSIPGKGLFSRLRRASFCLPRKS